MGFSEVLLIKPKLDTADAKKMEDDLNGRFGRIANKFGKGLLKSFIGGGILGGAFAAINRLLNPLEEVEARIKALLGQSTDIRDTADHFGTTAGKFFKLQQLSHVAGLDDAGLKDLLETFKTQQDLAKKELADPSQGVHRSTVALKNFANEKDVADAFFRVIAKIQEQEPDVQKQTIEAIFGDKITGGAKRLFNLDLLKENDKLGSTDALQKRLDKDEEIAKLNRGLEARRNIQRFIKQSDAVSPESVRTIDAIDKAKIQKEAQQITDLEKLKNAAVTIEAIKTLAEQGLSQIEKLFGLLAPVVPILNGISQGRGLRLGGFSLFGGGGDGGKK
jgi:hypothetical protein